MTNTIIEYDEALILGGTNTATLFAENYKTSLYDVDSIVRDYSLIVFTGGPDVDPASYGENPHPETHCSTERDLLEREIYKEAFRNNIPMVGICRGAQFLCVMNGDKLVQHVTGHSYGYHDIITKTGDTIKVLGDHHQMMLPEKGEIVAFSHGLSDRYRNGDDKEISMPLVWPGGAKEPEAVWYANSRCLCIQWHPEWDIENEKGLRYFQSLLEEHVL